MRKKEPNRNSGSLKQTKFSYFLIQLYSCTTVFKMSQFKENISKLTRQNKSVLEKNFQIVYIVQDTYRWKNFNFTTRIIRTHLDSNSVLNRVTEYKRKRLM